MPIAYANGGYRPLSEIGISLSDAGFVWGATVTDRCRTYRHRPFRLDDHLRRFRRSCRLAGVPLEKTEAELRNIVDELLERNGASGPTAKESVLVFLATPGPMWTHRPTLIIHPERLDQERYAATVNEGASLLIADGRHVPAASVPPEIKHRSRLFWRVAEIEVNGRQPGASALLLDPDGYLTETASANLLLVIEGVVCSPRRSRVLPGISLQVIEELCGPAHLPFEERDLTREDLAVASEAMVTSTPYGVAPVRQIEGRSFTAPGPAFLRLTEAWRHELGFDPHAEFRKADQADQSAA